ncbi:hypothetical protein P7K49_000688 [Saguinus oedipus]|uniref:Uncharacterized protein n=1 Tax=Saguinus oedipus TaxID=9490 RepID=A0ABQ9WG28_SAGOE|nr:hypothetical protein P7K49_000688 [Saguinus oedipus]
MGQPKNEVEWFASQQRFSAEEYGEIATTAKRELERKAPQAGRRTRGEVPPETFQGPIDQPLLEESGSTPSALHHIILQSPWSCSVEKVPDSVLKQQPEDLVTFASGTAMARQNYTKQESKDSFLKKLDDHGGKYPMYD